MCAVHVGERAAVAGQAQARVEAPRRRPASAGTRPPGRASSRSRSTARRGRAGGRRRSAGGARAGTGRRARARGRASRGPPGRRGRSRSRRPATSVAVGLDEPRDAERPRLRALLGVARAAARSGTPLWRATSRRRSSAARGPRAARVMCSWFGVHPQLAAGALDDRRGLAVVVGVRVRADEQPHVLEAQVDHRPSRARGGPASPGSCMPVSTSTMPSPAASAQALQCGTPGHGSGRRSRQTPGSTRSPRPSSRLRVGSAWAASLWPARDREAAVADCARARRARGQEADVQHRSAAARRIDRRDRAVARATSTRSTRATSTRPSRCWRRAAASTSAARSTRVAPEGVRAFFGELFAAFPDFDARGPRDHRPGRPLPPCAGALTRDVRRARARSRASTPTGAPHRHRGLRRASSVARRPDREQRRLHRRHDHRAPARRCCRRGTRGAEQRMTRAFNAKTRPRGARWPASRARSPTASGSCAAASRGRR